MAAPVSPTARSRQRYVNGCRLVAGCIPYRYNNSCDACNGDSQGRLEVLMVTPHRGEGFLFPKVTEPLVRVLRLVDGEGMPMGFIYEAMDRAKEAISHYYRGNTRKCEILWRIIDRRWTNQLHQPIHAFAYFLNPKFYFSDSFRADEEVMAGVIACIDKMTPDAKLRDKVLDELEGGWETHETKEAAACREALEEAGVRGDIMNCLGSWEFTSKSCQDEHGLQRRVYMYLLHVTKVLDSWPEDDVRERKWVPVTEAMDLCKNEWMRKALLKFRDCLEGGYTSSSSPASVDDSASDSLSHVSDEQPSEQLACEETVPASAVILSDNAASDDEAPSCMTEENASSSSD